MLDSGSISIFGLGVRSLKSDLIDYTNRKETELTTSTVLHENCFIVSQRQRHFELPYIPNKK